MADPPVPPSTPPDEPPNGEPPNGEPPNGEPGTGESRDGEPQEFVLREPLGSVLARLAARLFDAALIVLVALASVPLPKAGQIAFLVAVPIIYETLMVARAGRTVGKMLLGLHVVRRSDGGPPDWGAALARGSPSGILAAPPTVALVVTVLGLLPMIGDVRLQRSLQDRLARTVVVQRQRPWGARSAARPSPGST